MIVEYRGSTNKWLTRGCRYSVLEVFVNAQKQVMYRIFSEHENTPFLEDSSWFLMVDGDVPKSWALWTDGKGSFSLTFKEWHAAGFWEAYFDGEEWAISLFREGFTQVS